MTTTAQTAASNLSLSLERDSAPAAPSTGAVRATLRLESLALMGAGLLGFSWLDGSGWAFAILFLVPDLSALGYLIDKRWGARLYNAAHTLLFPALLGGLALALGEAELGRLAALWLAHIGFDRALGFGLKYPTQFRDTHLSRV